MTRLLRFLCWLRDSLPLRSERHASRAFLRGYELGCRSLGLGRDRRGRFARLP